MVSTYVYGSGHGSQHDDIIAEADGEGNASREIRRRTHWDPRIEVSSLKEPIAEVQIGIVPPTLFSDRYPGENCDDSTPIEDIAPDGVMEWFSDNGQFMQLDRDGLNRLIEALQEAGAATFGRDRW